MSNLKEQILQSMRYQDYRRYYEQELGEIGKLNSSGWATALCPFHNDTDPSLNINFFKEGAWKCHGCSESGDLFTFHQKKHGTDFKGALEYFANFMNIDPNIKPKKKPKKKKKPLGPPVTIFQYRNLAGKVVYETCKYENPKDYRQRRPHPTKEGEFLWNLKDIEVIPYNLQAVVKADHVFMPEGEKDADRLAQIGLTATCNPMGAGKWWNSLTPYFKDKTVTILPDNDDPGKKHAELVAHKLHGTAKSIQIVNLPNLPPGGDVTDWLNAGNTKADLLEVIKNQKPYEDHIDFLNKRHAVITVNGRTQILNEDIDRSFNRPTISFSSVQDLHIKYGNRLIPNPNAGIQGQNKMINIVSDWIRSLDRRQYDDIIFAPGQEINGCYNLWRGFAVEPKKGDWSLFRQHIFEIISGGKQHINDWILTWMARIVQDPGGKRSGTALVLRGDQGVGKGVFLSGYGRIFGDHFLQVNHQNQLTGRFNHHFKNAVFLFVDEGFWAGDKAAEAVVKGLITEDVLVIEPKGKDVFKIKNHINIAFASNDEWVIPAGLSERRFMVTDVSGSMKQDKVYFGAIIKQLQNGGYEGMLYDLLEHDTSKVDVSKIINTSAMLDQKIASMNPVQKFWFEKLRDGRLQDSDSDWNEIILSENLYEQYIEFCKKIGVRHRKISKQFGKEVKDLCPDLERRNIKCMSHDTGNCMRKWHYQFPPLEVCRNFFEQKTGYELDWDNDKIFINGEFED